MIEIESNGGTVIKVPEHKVEYLCSKGWRIVGQSNPAPAAPVDDDAEEASED